MRELEPETRWKLWTLGAAILLLVITVTAMLQGVPKIWAPFPVHIFILMMLAGPLAFVLPAMAFLLWSRQLFRGVSRVPFRSIGALVILCCLSFWYFYSVWSEGVTRYGTGYVAAVAAVNAGFIAALSGIALVGTRRPKFVLSLLFHSLFFLWLGWYAFPYFGEGP